MSPSEQQALEENLEDAAVRKHGWKPFWPLLRATTKNKNGLYYYNTGPND